MSRVSVEVRGDRGVLDSGRTIKIAKVADGVGVRLAVDVRAGPSASRR
jgi:hypothetical protein